MGRGMIDAGNPELPVSGFGYDSYRDNRRKAIEALAVMKSLEREKSGAMRMVRLDSRTVVCATKERMTDIINDYERRSSGKIRYDEDN